MNIKRMSISFLAAVISAATLLSCNVKEENGDRLGTDPEKPAATEIRFKAQLPDAPAGFKTTWTSGDEIVVYSVKGNFTSKETIKATEVTSDGKTATFVSTGKLLKDAGYFYGMLKDCGIKGFKLKQYWSTDNMDRCRDAVPSVTVAACDANDMTLSFRNIFALLKVTVTNPDTKYIKVCGNNGEVINKNTFIAFANYDLSDNPSPDFEETVSIRKYVNGAEDCYIGLRPGILLSSGYTIIACDASDNVIGRVASYEAIETEPGKVYDAGTLEAPRELSPVFDESRISLSLAAISDIHIEGSGDAYALKFVSALNQLKAEAAKNDADGIDGVLVAGDLIQRAEITMAQNFKNLYEEVFKPEDVPMIYTVGNHDMNSSYAWSQSTVAQSVAFANTLGDEYFKTDVDNTMRNNYEARHCIVGGYHILAVTPNGDQPVVYSQNVINWLDQQLEAITRTDPNRYVIVLTHPMIHNTIYGSLLGEEDGIWTSTLPEYWATKALTSVLEKYPQIVSFHGHLHFPINDPRSLWQGKWTALGCGSTRYMAIEPAGWEGISGTPTVMNDANNFSQGYLVQFDINGNMRVIKMDFFNQDTIGEPYVMRYPSADGANLAKYNNDSRKAANQAPTLGTVEVKDVKEAEAVSVTFAAGKDDEFVHHYVVTLSKAGTVIATKKILADFYLHPKTSGMKSSWTVDFGTLSEPGQYTVTVVAYDSWDAESAPASAAFNCGDVTPAEKVDKWADDAAGSQVISASGTPTGSDGWLTYADGKVHWTANTTGFPRTATLTFENGSSFKLTQIAPADFKGNWTFTTKVFAGSGSYVTANDPYTFQTVTFADPRNKEPLKAADGNTYANNIGIKGLYFDTVLDACVDIDYDKKSVRFGVFLDTRDGAGQLANGKYATYFPGLATRTATAWGKPWLYTETELGNPDYEWLWFAVSSDFKTLMYENRISNNVEFQALAQYSDKSMNQICGFGVVISNTNVFNHNTVKAYSNFYQVNPKNQKGEFFQRK